MTVPEEKEENQDLSRREFVGTAAKGGALVGLGAVAAFAASRLRKRPAQGQRREHKELGEDFYYNVESYEKTDPSLIRYSQTGSIQTGFKVARSIALGPKGNIFVAGDRAIKAFAANGDAAGKMDVDGLPRGLCVTEEREILVGLKNRVEVRDSDGAVKSSWKKLDPPALLTSIAVSGDNVFLADAGNRVVHRHDRSGKFIQRIGEKDADQEILGFVIPSPFFCLCVAPDGLLRVTNPGRHRIEAYTFDGHLEFSWGKPSITIEGFCGCCNPVNFAMFPNGRHVTCEKGLPRVKVYDADGKFESVVAGPEQFKEYGKIVDGESNYGGLKGGLDVAVDSRQRILVLDAVAGEVRIFEEKSDG